MKRRKRKKRKKGGVSEEKEIIMGGVEKRNERGRRVGREEGVACIVCMCDYNHLHSFHHFLRIYCVLRIIPC